MEGLFGYWSSVIECVFFSAGIVRGLKQTTLLGGRTCCRLCGKRFGSVFCFAGSGRFFAGAWRRCGYGDHGRIGDPGRGHLFGPRGEGPMRYCLAPGRSMSQKTRRSSIGGRSASRDGREIAIVLRRVRPGYR